ncbi:winged helix-turn-helix transcriptional regulator [Clostridium mediterraneense]|uniref:winged helix-turn-helix transcriptional regulator n=1 Tax=Clostridium mediterraneense TaxID=1805472 RepID=UPI000A073F74|nr:winged helix-turn-helix transcriptional regulator [Clostridium mediterraneense]
MKHINDDDLLKEIETDCYLNVNEAIGVIGGKWKVLILWHITERTRRFNELRKLIPDISQKMLTNQLRELEKDNLICRTVYPEVPPRVEYSLTEYGGTLEPIFDALYDWGENHIKRKSKK